MDKIVILDRDGVVNKDSDGYIKSAEEWTPIPGSIEAIIRLNNAGFRVGIVSNQSGLARGLFDHEALGAMHRKLHDLLARQGGRVEMIAYCPHGPNDACDCRKPQPGLLRAIGERMGVDLRGAPLVGDSWSDMEAAMAIGMEPWMVRTGKGARYLAAAAPKGVRVFEDLRAVADALAKNGTSA